MMKENMDGNKKDWGAAWAKFREYCEMALGSGSPKKNVGMEGRKRRGIGWEVEAHCTSYTGAETKREEIGPDGQVVEKTGSRASLETEAEGEAVERGLAAALDGQTVCLRAC